MKWIVFKELIKAQKLLWKDDDLMQQETLFKLQDLIAKLLLNIAREHVSYGELFLIKEFPYLYKKR